MQLTKNKELEEKNLDFSLPSHIKEEVNNKWFYLYEWISPKDVKMSIERDFLKLLNIIWLPLAIVITLLGVIFLDSVFIFLFYWQFIFVVFIILLIYLLFSSIRKSYLFSKNAFLVLTDKYLLLNWKISNVENTKEILWKDIVKISKVFEENLFSESRIDKSKNELYKKVLSKLYSWYERIFKIMLKWNNKNMVWFGLLAWIFYTFYAILMCVIYFIWISFVWIVWIFITWINELILYKLWHEFTIINSLFLEIWRSSDNIKNEKDNLLNNLENAKKNEWKDWLLTNINDWITKINSSANNAINDSIMLKEKLFKSKHREIFNYWIYNNWIKKQVLEPLKEIYNLVKTNLDILVQTTDTVGKQILQTSDDSYKWVLNAQKVRLEMRIEELKKHLELINVYITKIS